MKKIKLVNCMVFISIFIIELYIGIYFSRMNIKSLYLK